MQPTLHFQKKLAIEIKIASFFYKMYCGLHFQFRRAHYYSWKSIQIELIDTFQIKRNIKKYTGLNDFF
jgi:hypothetical protein